MKILIVEDDRISWITLFSYISQMGYEPLLANNSREAIMLWEQEQPSFVLTNWHMPKNSGIDLIKYIRQNEGDSYTYTILITARDKEEDLVKGFEAGVDDYLIKPVKKLELFLRIKVGERLLDLQSKEILVFALAALAEMKDPETGEHLKRIRIYSRILAERMSQKEAFAKIINKRFIENIYNTSPLHDVGKVGVPDAILQKSGKLTEEEFKTMKTHTLMGQETLLSVCKQGHSGKHLNMAAEIAGSHHEKWDGTGYPLGLKGEEIPLAARIVALADVYDALRSRRVYKESYSHEKAKTEILKETAKHFDPNVVQAFLEVEDQFNAISMQITS